MAEALRVVLFSHDVDGFAVAREACLTAGHLPVAYVFARSLRPRRPSGPNAAPTVGGIVEALPSGMDLLLPGSADGLRRTLPGYRPDLLVCNGFPWRIPREVLEVARLGGINIHPSLLPRHRGPIPIHWAIRNGDPEIGVTIHRMEETFDSGRVLAQRGGVPLEDDVVPETLFGQLDALTRELLVTALDRVVAGFPGKEQNDSEATYAGWMEEEFSHIDWSRPAREVHNQVRAFRFGVPGPPGPLAQTDGSWIAVLRTRTDPGGGGLRVECADGPLWIVESVPVEPPRR